MTTNQQGTTSPFDVHLLIERDGDKFKIQSNKLQEIGQQLRGKSRFSVFNSIILPLMVTLATTLLTGTFQYVSWQNQVWLQAASDVVERAAETYQAAADALGKRRYVTYLFAPAIRDLAAVPPAEQQAMLQDEKMSLRTETPKLVLMQHNAKALHRLDQQLSASRFDAYYVQLREWNENHDKLLTAIDNNLDRPIFEHAGQRTIPHRAMPFRSGISTAGNHQTRATETGAQSRQSETPVCSDPRVLRQSQREDRRTEVTQQNGHDGF
jgi:hypothetical protein